MPRIGPSALFSPAVPALSIASAAAEESDSEVHAVAASRVAADAVGAAEAMEQSGPFEAAEPAPAPTLVFAAQSGNVAAVRFGISMMVANCDRMNLLRERDLNLKLQRDFTEAADWHAPNTARTHLDGLRAFITTAAPMLLTAKFMIEQIRCSAHRRDFLTASQAMKWSAMVLGISESQLAPALKEDFLRRMSRDFGQARKVLLCRHVLSSDLLSPEEKGHFMGELGPALDMRAKDAAIEAIAQSTPELQLSQQWQPGVMKSRRRAGDSALPPAQPPTF